MICLGPAKEAALYFDHVFPLDLNAHIAMMFAGAMDRTLERKEILSPCVPSISSDEFDAVISSLLGENKLAKGGYHAQASLALTLFSARVTLGNCGGGPQQMDDLILESEWYAIPEFREVLDACYQNGRLERADLYRFGALFEEIVEAAGFKRCPTWDADRRVPNISGVPVFSSRMSNDYFAAVSGLAMVDASKVSWEAIIEFRKRKESRAALRDLRLFLENDFEGKDTNFVIDTLLSRIERHEAELKVWGFELANRTLGVAVSKESLLSTSLASLSASLFGAPLTAAAGAAMAITVGSCAVEVGQAIIERKKGKLGDPVRYLTSLKDKFHR